MKPKIKQVWIIGLTMLSVLLSSCDFSVLPPPPKYYIFENMAECENITQDTTKDIQTEVLDLPDQHQRYVDGLSYHSFYGASFTASTFEFEIYAFEFTTEEDAQKYFQNLTGKNTKTDSTTFSSSSGITTFELTAINHKYAYTVYAPSKYSKQVTEFINSKFSVLIT